MGTESIVTGKGQSPKSAWRLSPVRNLRRKSILIPQPGTSDNLDCKAVRSGTNDAHDTADELKRDGLSLETIPGEINSRDVSIKIALLDASRQSGLLERCADATKKYLVEKFGVAGSDLVTVGYGKSQLKKPEVPNDPANRRVQVVNMVSKTASK